jgi:hypothetical protein
MKSSIQNELNEFKKYHKNKFNVTFHIICGIFFMSFLLLKFGRYKNIALLGYFILLLLTINSKKNPDAGIINIIIAAFLFITISKLKEFKYSQFYLTFLFLIFYFLPDVSHYLTNEKTVMNINNITLFSAFVNIFYLLPFSILSI